MGGYGSGPRYPSRYELVERCSAIDAQDYQRKAVRQGWRATDGIQPIVARLPYGLAQELHIWTRPGTLGGVVWYFVCPRCAQRRRKLYRPISESGARYACRVCHRLRYQTQRIDRRERLKHRVWKIERRMGGKDPDSGGMVWKPRRMHQRTFDRWMDKRDELDGELVAIVVAEVDRLLRRVA